MLRMETHHAVDICNTSLFTNQSMVDEKDDAKREAAAVMMTLERDTVVEAMVKVMGEKMMT